MIKRTLAEIAVMAGGSLSDEAFGSISVKGVSKDTRSIEAGNIYIPLIGDAFDGHQFVQAAFDQGAAASFWQRDRGKPPEGCAVVLVDDTLAVLQLLAKSYKNQLNVRIVGITGSNGKTTTKDLTAAVLAVSFRVHKTGGNYNNHIGLPLTLLQLEEDTQIAVLEMGMSGRGEIEFLSKLAEPEIAVITNIGEAHLLQLGSRLEIARAKTEILAGLRPGGTLVYFGDEPLIPQVLPEMTAPARMKAAEYHKVLFGTGAGNHYVPRDIRMDEKGAYFRVNESKTEFYIPMLGSHNVVNALAAYAVGKYFGLDDSAIAQGFAEVQATGMRIEVTQAKSGLTIWNDAYNASPTSVRAALTLLHQADRYKRKYVVLGDMLELGTNEAAFHHEVGAFVDPDKVEAVLTFGPLSVHIAEGARTRFPADRVKHYDDKQSLARDLAAMAGGGDVVLIKGSRGMKMEQVAALVLQLEG